MDHSSFHRSWLVVSEAASDELTPSSGSLPCKPNFFLLSPSSSPLAGSGKFLFNEPPWFTQLLEISFKGSVRAAEPAIRPTGPGGPWLAESDPPASGGRSMGTGLQGSQLITSPSPSAINANNVKLDCSGHQPLVLKVTLFGFMPSALL